MTLHTVGGAFRHAGSRGSVHSSLGSPAGVLGGKDFLKCDVVLLLKKCIHFSQTLIGVCLSLGSSEGRLANGFTVNQRLVLFVGDVRERILRHFLTGVNPGVVVLDVGQSNGRHRSSYVCDPTLTHVGDARVLVLMYNLPLVVSTHNEPLPAKPAPVVPFVGTPALVK